jgi:hypothetical protein
MSRGHEWRLALPYPGLIELLDGLVTKAEEVILVAEACEGHEKRSPCTLRECLAEGAEGVLGLRPEPHRRMHKKMVDVTGSTKVERKKARVPVSLEPPAFMVSPRQLGAYRVAEPTHQPPVNKLGLRERPQRKRQDLRAARVARECEERSVSPNDCARVGPGPPRRRRQRWPVIVDAPRAGRLRPAVLLLERRVYEQRVERVRGIGAGFGGLALSCGALDEVRMRSGGLDSPSQITYASAVIGASRAMGSTPGRFASAADASTPSGSASSVATRASLQASSARARRQYRATTRARRAVDGLVNPREKRREVDEPWSPAPAHKGDGARQDG